jgi:hypothetical protein
MWVLAIALLTLFARHDLAVGAMGFTLGECWLIGLGCVGQPMLALHLLGTEPSPRACERVAVGSYTAAGLVTVLLACGQMHDKVLIAVFLLILPLAFAIQSGNAAQAIARRSYDRATAGAEGEERGWIACLLAVGRTNEAREERVHSLIAGADDTAELRYDLDAIQAEIEARRARKVVTPLRAINGANGKVNGSALRKSAE